MKITPLNRPVDVLDWDHAPYTPEQRAEWAAQQKQYDALREQFRCEWVPLLGYSAEHDNEEMENVECAAFSAWQERRKGRTAAASTPVWVDAFEYWLINGPHMEDDGVLAQQPTAVSFTLPIVLKGGGNAQITFETRKHVDTKYHPEQRTWFDRKHRLVVRTEHGVFAGHLIDECGERNWYVVSLPANAPQEVADRIAKTLDAIQELDLAKDYLAIMPVSDRCSICVRPLTDIVSKTLGLGPDCAAKLKIAHSTAVADTIIVKRRAFLAEEVGAPIPLTGE